MKIQELLEDGRIVKGVNTTVDVGVDEIPRQAKKFGNKVDKDGKPPTLSKKVKGKSTNVLFNLGLAEGKHIPNPKNTFLTKADSAYDHYKIGTNLANLKAVPKGANYDEPDVIIAPYAGKKEMKYLMKQLKRIGYDVQDAAGYQDAHFDDEPTGGEAPPQVKNYGPLGRVKLGQLRSVQKERSYKKLIKQLERVLKDDYAPIQIDRKGRIVNGHHRYDALRLAGAEYARVYMADDVLEDMLDEGWSKKYKDSINCSNPKGFSQKAHCAGKKKNENFAEQKAHDAIFQEILVDLLQKRYPDAEFDYQGDKVISADGKLTVIADLQVEDGYGGVWVWDVDTGPYKGVLSTAIRQATAELLRQQPDLKPALFVDGDNQNPGAWQAIANKLNYTLLDENFADGKVKGKSRPGRVKRSGASCKGSVTKLRKQAKNASGEKARMYHWCANMKSGRKKK